MGDAASTASSITSNPQSPIDALTASIDALDTPSSSGVSATAQAPDGYDPAVRIVLREVDVEPELRQGCAELCNHSVRGNIEWVAESSEPRRAAPDEYRWFVRFTREDPDAGPSTTSPNPRGCIIRPSHSDFTDLSSTHIPQSGLPSTQFSVSVRYRRRCEAYRALGHIVSQTRHCSTLVGDLPEDEGINGSPESQVPRFEWSGDTAGLERTEDCLFETLGIMIDCSRNGVLLVERVEELLRLLALMGCNMLQLYTEDTYEAGAPVESRRWSADARRSPRSEANRSSGTFADRTKPRSSKESTTTHSHCTIPGLHLSRQVCR